MIDLAGESDIGHHSLLPEGKERAPQLTVLVADRLAAMRDYTKQILKSTIQTRMQILEASSGTQAVELLKPNVPQFAIIDMTLPGATGLAVAKSIWNANVNAKILFVLSTFSEIYLRNIEQSLAPGAVYGLVMKSIQEKDLSYAIDCLLTHDNVFIDPEIRASRNRMGGPVCLLTELELETLQDVALGLTDKAISLRRNISVRGVQSRVASLFAKLLKGEDDRTRSILGVEVINPRARLIFHALRRGLLDVEQIDDWEGSFCRWLSEKNQKPNRHSDIADFSRVRTERPPQAAVSQLNRPTHAKFAKR